MKTYTKTHSTKVALKAHASKISNRGGEYLINDFKISYWFTKYEILYRGGFPLELNLIKSDGISFSKNIEVAKYWAAHRTGGALYTYKLSKNAKILTLKDFPKKIIPTEKPYSHQDKERIVRYAQFSKYDGVDLSDLFNENEVRIFNLKFLKNDNK